MNDYIENVKNYMRDMSKEEIEKNLRSYSLNDIINNTDVFYDSQDLIKELIKENSVQKELIKSLVNALDVSSLKAIRYENRLLELGQPEKNRGQFLDLVTSNINKCSEIIGNEKCEFLVINIEKYSKNRLM